VKSYYHQNKKEREKEGREGEQERGKEGGRNPIKAIHPVLSTNPTQ
jgi:DNA invertase Pin-like site-specific DNA recombinase